ncbi:MAG: hypothetical protein JNM36_07040 [Chitinophagales bacterium]|nr:hypothetical protein [Chitinophagales bacterium]
MSDSTTYPHIIYESRLTLIIALSDAELGKVMFSNPIRWVDSDNNPVDLGLEQPTAQKEAKMLRYANEINDLMPRFIEMRQWTTPNGEVHDMVVMERLEVLPIHHFDKSTRLQMLKVFNEKLEEQRNSFFLHNDIKRPTMYFNRGDKEWMYSNVIQTPSQLRLIDAGFARVYPYNDLSDFRMSLRRNLLESMDFGDYYMEEE